jgi:hypothetical protein
MEAVLQEKESRDSEWARYVVLNVCVCMCVYVCVCVCVCVKCLI